MRVALLGGGRSLGLLARGERPGGYGSVLAINDVVTEYPADFWVFGDPEVLSIVPAAEVVGTPRGFVGECVVAGLVQPAEAGRTVGERLEGMGFDEWDRVVMRPPEGEGSGWQTWSSTAGLVLAVNLGASAIDCYGCDMRGELDWRGRWRDRRDPERWRKERRDWDAVVGWLERIGVKVTRKRMRAGR